MALVTLELAKAQLSITHTADDLLLDALIAAASEGILTYLKAEAVPEAATFAAQQATMILVAEWYKNREAEQQGQVDAQFGYGFLPQPVLALLFPHRDPAVA